MTLRAKGIRMKKSTSLCLLLILCISNAYSQIAEINKTGSKIRISPNSKYYAIFSNVDLTLRLFSNEKEIYQFYIGNDSEFLFLDNSNLIFIYDDFIAKIHLPDLKILKKEINNFSILNLTKDGNILLANRANNLLIINKDLNILYQNKIPFQYTNFIFKIDDGYVAYGVKDYRNNTSSLLKLDNDFKVIFRNDIQNILETPSDGLNHFFIFYDQNIFYYNFGQNSFIYNWKNGVSEKIMFNIVSFSRDTIILTDEENSSELLKYGINKIYILSNFNQRNQYDAVFSDKNRLYIVSERKPK